MEMKYRLTIYFTNNKVDSVEIQERINLAETGNAFVIRGCDKEMFINLDHVLSIIEERLPEAENEGD